MAFFRQR
jgi:hypothetical protein